MYTTLHIGNQAHVGSIFGNSEGAARCRRRLRVGKPRRWISLQTAAWNACAAHGNQARICVQKIGEILRKNCQFLLRNAGEGICQNAAIRGVLAKNLPSLTCKKAQRELSYKITAKKFVQGGFLHLNANGMDATPALDGPAKRAAALRPIKESSSCPYVYRTPRCSGSKNAVRSESTRRSPSRVSVIRSPSSVR